jgi:transposase
MDERNLQAENERLRVENEHLLNKVSELEGRIEKLMGIIESLQRGNKRQAAPFSKGPPKPDPKPPGRKPGDAYGRQAFRAAPPCIDEVYVAPLPERCPICESSVTLESVEIQYQTEIPRRPIYRQFNVHVGRCTRCRKRLQGRHPLQSSNALGAAASQIGSDAQSLATILNKEAGLSHGKVQAFFKTAFGIVIARATSARTMLRAARRCEPAFKEIQIAVKHSDWCVPDETGWKVGGLLQWLHGFVTQAATLYLIRPSRGFDVAEEALSRDYAGALTHDGWKTYEQFESAVHGQCNAHLLRRCNHLLETATRGAVIFPRQVKTLLLKGLALRDKREAQEITLDACAKKARKLSRTMESLCGPKTHLGNEQFAKFLYQRANEVFNHLRDPRLDATNWRAEQAIRPAVVNRKVWGGNRTQAGAEAQGCLTSLLRTAWQRGLQALDFISQTLRALPGQAPKLLFATP